MKIVKGTNIVLTGGGSGIGRSICLQLVKKGANVAILDLNLSAMEETKKLAEEYNSAISIHQINISDKNAVDNLVSELLKKYNHIDCIINNAGIIQPFIPIKDLHFSTIENIVNVNFYGTLYLTKALLAHLISRPEAHIVNISSMGGFIPFPGQTLYSATKAAVKILTEGLYAELMDTSVKVTLVMPGAVNTNITKNSGVEIKASVTSDYGNFLSADTAAEIIINAIEKDKARVLVGKDANFLDIFYRFFPTKAIRFIANKMKNM
jgi:short-subunit dehydrogenase